LFKEVPCVAGFINDVVEDGDSEFVSAQIFPDVLYRIEFRSVRRQARKGDVFGNGERGGNVIAGTIEDKDSVAIRTLILLSATCGIFKDDGSQ
jgi:hypothetical protein